MRIDDGGEFWEELKEIGKEFCKAAIVIGGIASAIGITAISVAGTIGTGGVGAMAIPAALSLAEAALTVSVAAATVGVATVGIANVAETITYAKAGDGIGEHTNGTKNWDKHSKKRPGDSEKGDVRRTDRINKKKRNLNKKPNKYNKMRGR